MLHSNKDSLYSRSLNPFSNLIRIIRRLFGIFLVIIPLPNPLSCYGSTKVYGLGHYGYPRPAERGIIASTSVLGEPTFDISWIQTQIEAVKSKNISLKVIRAVKLTEDPDFMGTTA